jgi:hypothetical protein
MTKNENKFEQYVNSLGFDDAPSKEHQDKLEKKVLEAYDYQKKYGDHVEPVAIYLRKLSIAAGFLIICGVLFWAVDKVFITQETDFIANHPDKEILQEIIEDEQASGAEKMSLIARMSDIWDMITNKEADALVSVLQTEDLARTVRTWAATYLGKFGTVDTLAMLEDVISRLGISDPNDPLKIAAATIRERLNSEEQQTRPQDKFHSDSPPAMRSADESPLLPN